MANKEAQLLKAAKDVSEGRGNATTLFGMLERDRDYAPIAARHPEILKIRGNAGYPTDIKDGRWYTVAHSSALRSSTAAVEIAKLPEILVLPDSNGNIVAFDVAMDEEGAMELIRHNAMLREVGMGGWSVGHYIALNPHAGDTFVREGGRAALHDKVDILSQENEGVTVFDIIKLANGTVDISGREQSEKLKALMGSMRMN